MKLDGDVTRKNLIRNMLGTDFAIFLPVLFLKYFFSFNLSLNVLELY